jgi:dTDP-4-dehydrorhamnose reductase
MIWVTGSRGMLGTDVVQVLEGSGFEVAGTDIEVDITDLQALLEFAGKKRIDWIVNCAAYTAVDRAEDEPDRARALNAEGALNIARAAAESGACLVHISTDYVFDGSKKGSWLEDDPVNPECVYGRTKQEGEELVRGTLESHYIVRTSWLFGIHGKSFVSTMLGLFRKGARVRVVADQHGCPTSTLDLARGIEALIRGRGPSGTYHFCNTGETTWYEFARAIAEHAVERGLLEQPASIEPVETTGYPTPAKRPANSVLCTEKFRSTFGVTMKHWPEALREYLELLAAGG